MSRIHTVVLFTLALVAAQSAHADPRSIAHGGNTDFLKTHSQTMPGGTSFVSERTSTAPTIRLSIGTPATVTYTNKQRNTATLQAATRAIVSVHADPATVASR